MRKTIAAAVLAVAGAAALGLGGTYAGFTATQDLPVLVEGGRLELTLTNQRGVATRPVQFADLVPGQGRNYFVRLTNDGTVAATAQWAFADVRNPENGCLPPEGAVNDTSCGTGDDQGELGSQLEVTFSLMGTPECQGTQTPVNPRRFPAVAGLGFADIQAGTAPRLVLAPDQSACVRVRVVFPERGDENNLAQGDSTEFRFDFRLNQRT